MLKLYAMFGNHSKIETEDAEESDFETQRMVMEATSVHATRYYFGVLKFEPSTVSNVYNKRRNVYLCGL